MQEASRGERSSNLSAASSENPTDVPTGSPLVIIIEYSSGNPPGVPCKNPPRVPYGNFPEFLVRNISGVSSEKLSKRKSD